MSEHVGDLAARYALGDLDVTEIAALEEHTATCASCLRLVGEAEETVLALEGGDTVAIVPTLLEERAAIPIRRRIPVAKFAGAIAAGLVIGILGTLISLWPRENETQHALIAMVGSHFSHAQFVPVSDAHAPDAKVIFARDHRWLYVIADGAERYDVYTVNRTSSQRLGQLQPSGATSTLYVNFPFAEGTIELRDGATVVERATVR